MKKLFWMVVLSLFGFSLYSAEYGFHLTSLRFGVEPVFVSLVEARSIPCLETKIKDCESTGNSPFVSFIGASYFNLMHLRDYIISYHQIVQEEQDHKALGDMTLLRHEAERGLHFHCAGSSLSADELVRLVYNASSLFENKQVPRGLLNPLVAKIVSGEFPDYERNGTLLNLPLVYTALLTQLDQIKEDNDCNKRLLRQVITKNGKRESILTCLLGSYSKNIKNKSVNLSSYQNSWLSFLYRPVVNYVYLDPAMTIELSGMACIGFPNKNYKLVVRSSNESPQEFKLPDKHFEVKGCFSNKNEDKFVFVCPYSNPVNGTERGICIIDGRNKEPEIVTRGLDNAKVCCCDKSGILYGFDEHGNIFSLSGEKYNNRTNILAAQLQNVRGLLYDELRKRFIYWNDQLVFQGEFTLDMSGHGSIVDVIMSPTGKKICIKTISDGKMSHGDQQCQYFLYDDDQRRTFSLYKDDRNQPRSIKVNGESFVSFSSDGNLLTIGFNNDGSINYDFFDTLSWQSWQHQTSGRLAFLSGDFSIEVHQKEDWSYCSRMVMLFDTIMLDAVKLLTNDYFSPFEQHPCKINMALMNRFGSDLQGNDSYQYPSEIKRIFAAQKKPHETKQIDHQIEGNKSFSQLIRQALYNHRLAIGGVGLLAVMAYLYGLRVK